MQFIANYHTHTRWCRHGVGEIEDYIKSGIENRLVELAITEHVPLRDNMDKRRMPFEEFEAYNKELDTMIEKYKDKIRIYKGFECEYYPEVIEDHKRFREEYGYKLLILGQHRCGIDRSIDNFKPKDRGALYLYAETVIRGLDTGLYHFLAHPDLVLTGYEGGWDIHSQRVMGQIFKKCEEFDIPIEINGNGLYTHRDYPNKNAFLLSKEYKLRYIVNTDAHNPKLLAGKVSDMCMDFAKEIGVEPMQIFDDFK